MVYALPYSRLLVTGGAGFIGSNFVHHVFHRSGAAHDCCPDETAYGEPASGELPAVLNLDKMTYAANSANLAGVEHARGYAFAQADICDATAVDKAFSTFKPDAVVHFAAESHVDRSIASGVEFAKTNVVGTQVLLDAARRHDVQHFLHVSTDEVYGSRRTGSFNERDPLHTASPYSASKAGSDLLVLAHGTTYGIKAHITRCTNNYGPRQHPEKLVPKTLQRAQSGKKIPIYGSGLQVRDWLYVKDHCAAILHVLGLKDWGEVYNVAARDEKTNLDVVGRLLQAVGKPKDFVEHVTDRPGHDFRYSLDDSKLRATGWSSLVNFEQGLQWTLEVEA